MTSQDILKRYDMTVDNRFIVHANIPSYTALFENYDYTSSFYKRDVNEKLAEYLTDCTREIGSRNDVVIRFDLPEEGRSETEEADLVTGFQKYKGGEYFWMVKNKKYWGQPAGVDEMVFKGFGRTDTINMALKKGAIEFIGYNGSSPLSVEDFKRTENMDVAIAPGVFDAF